MKLSKDGKTKNYYMTGLSTINSGQLSHIERQVESLIGQDIDIKTLFFESLKNGYSPEQIGSFFEQSLIEKERKNKGQYYTSKSIVEYMLSQLDIKKDSNILDPSCGCGSFLLTAFDVFKEKYGDSFLKNIYGVDLNEKAAQITQACLFMKMRFKGTCRKTLANNIKVGNSLISNNLLTEKAFSWQDEFNDIFLNGGFDFVIGNPPYVTLRQFSDFDPKELAYSNIINGPVNAASLMLIKALEVLKPNGVLAFLLPKSILFVNSYKKLRNHLLQQTHLLQIFDLGSKFKDVRSEQVILIVKKTTRKNEKHKVNIRILNKKEKRLDRQPSIFVRQQLFAKLNKFLTFDDERCYDLIDKIDKIGEHLNVFVDGKIFRGLPVGGNRLAEKVNGKFSKKVIRGKNINKFCIKEPYRISEEVLDTQSKSKIKSLLHKKVVLQNIYSSEAGVIAAFDSEGILSLDTVTNIVVHTNGQGIYILALLNSKLVNFYLMYAMFGRSRLTMHLDKSYIGQVPVAKDVQSGMISNLSRIVHSAIDCKNFNDLKQKNQELDNFVYDIYGLRKNEINVVENAMSYMLSEKSRW